MRDHGAITEVTYKLPNQHYVPVDMRYIGVDNLTPCVEFDFTCGGKKRHGRRRRRVGWR